MNQSTAQGEFLHHTTRKSPCPTVTEAFYLRIDGLDRVVALFHGCIEQGGKELQVLLHGEITIEGELARHIADTTTHVTHLLHYIIAINRGVAPIGQQ